MIKVTDRAATFTDGAMFSGAAPIEFPPPPIVTEVGAIEAGNTVPNGKLIVTVLVPPVRVAPVVKATEYCATALAVVGVGVKPTLEMACTVCVRSAKGASMVIIMTNATTQENALIPCLVI